MDDILRLYDTEVRANPIYPPIINVVRDEHVTRMEGPFNYVCSWRFGEADAGRIVGEQAALFRDRGERLCWRIYSHDEPGNVEFFLRQEGFKPSTSGTLMALPLERDLPAAPAHDVRRLAPADGVDDYLAATGAAFGYINPADYKYFGYLLTEPDFTFFIAYDGTEPVAAARLEMPIATPFGLLFGGGVAPSHRGRGIYRALVAARITVARERGLKYLTTEAQDTSRPILERLGFMPLARETMWELR